MPTYIMVFFTINDVQRLYVRNYTIVDIEYFSKIQPKSSLQGFIDLLSRPTSIVYVTFVCVVSVIGVFGEYV